MTGHCLRTDRFPMKTPCARPRQFHIRLGRLLDAVDVPLVVAEPPRLQGETCAPILNPLFVFGKEKYRLGNLILTICPDDVETPWHNDAVLQKDCGLISEADVVMITRSDTVGVKKREAIREFVRSLNDTCEIVLFSVVDGEEVGAVTKAILEGKYSRPLIN